jgi:hypothetical protein
LINYPRYLTEKKGYKYPEETQSKVAGGLAKTAGFVGGAKNPIFKVMGITPASSLLKTSVAGGLSGAAYAQPMKSRVVSGVMGAALPGVAKGAEKAISKVPQATRFLSGRIINSLISPLLKDFSYGKNPGLGVAREGIVANSLDDLAIKIGGKRNQLGKEIGNVMKRNKSIVNTTGVLRPLDVALRYARKAPNINKNLISRLEGTREDLRGIIGGKDVKLSTASLAFEMKKQIGDLTKWTGAPSDDKVVNKALKMVYGRLKERIEKVVPEVKDLNERYANLVSAEVATLYRDKIASRQNMVGLAPKILSGGGAIYGLSTGNPEAIIAGIAVLGADKVLASPAFKTRLASGLMKMSNVDKARIFKAYPAIKNEITRVMNERYLSKNRLGVGLSIKDVSKEAKISTPNVMGGDTIPLGNKNIPVGKRAMQNLRAKKENSALLAEARKYKTAEEFIKDKDILYHGTQAPEFSQFEGITYFTKDKKEALGFAEGKHLGGKTGGKVRAIDVVSNLKNKKNVDEFIIDDLMEGNIDEAIKRELDIAKKEGFDSISFTHPSNYHDGEFEAIVPVDSSQIKTKSQLTALWHEAQKSLLKKATKK